MGKNLVLVVCGFLFSATLRAGVDDILVNREYNRLISVISANPYRDSESRIDELRDAQEKWALYRDATCDFVSNHPQVEVMVEIENQCLSEFNAQRIKTLNKYIDSMGSQ